MSLRGRTVDELIRIASAGGGLRFDAAGRLTEELIRIASASKSGGGQLILIGMSGRLTDELIRIGAAGRGHVVFED
jgi:DNA replication protein